MRASLYRMTPVWPHGDEQVMMLETLIAPWGHSYPQPPFPSETPFDAASIAHDAGNVLADALVEHGLPWHQLETDAVIDHGEAAASESRRADKRAATSYLSRRAHRIQELTDLELETIALAGKRPDRRKHLR